MINLTLSPPGHTSPMTTVPSGLKEGDRVMVIAPSLSINILSDTTIARASELLRDRLGLEVVIAANADKESWMGSPSVADRLEDLHGAFKDPGIAGILTCIGGFNSNELLDRIDYPLIKAHPKILCGFSDITALQNAILAKTGMVTYSGPHFSTFGMRGVTTDYILDYFRRMLFGRERVAVGGWRPKGWATRAMTISHHA